MKNALSRIDLVICFYLIPLLDGNGGRGKGGVDVFVGLKAQNFLNSRPSS